MLMHLIIHRRAEVALRSLNPTERKKILQALDLLQYASIEELNQSGKFHKIHAASGERLYIYRSSRRLRIVLSKNENEWTVEDIVDHDRLDRLLPGRGRS
jgi:hypothetical protein